MKKILFKTFLLWIPFAALITFTCGLSYLLVQQDLRQTANDPQIQIAEDISQALTSGQVGPQDIIPPGQTLDISTSLDSYVIIYDASGTVLASSAMLQGQTPMISSSVFANVEQHGEDRFTWQPAPGVRSAVVVDYIPASASSGPEFVLAGRSIREVETREENILHIAEFAWLMGLIVMFAVVWGVVWVYKRKVYGSS